jgi:hypothetical protein
MYIHSIYNLLDRCKCDFKKELFIFLYKMYHILLICCSELIENNKYVNISSFIRRKRMNKKQKANK